jgi:hypothetical protein
MCSAATTNARSRPFVHVVVQLRPVDRRGDDVFERARVEHRAAEAVGRPVFVARLRRLAQEPERTRPPHEAEQVDAQVVLQLQRAPQREQRVDPVVVRVRVRRHPRAVDGPDRRARDDLVQPARVTRAPERLAHALEHAGFVGSTRAAARQHQPDVLHASSVVALPARRQKASAARLPVCAATRPDSVARRRAGDVPSSPEPCSALLAQRRYAVSNSSVTRCTYSGLKPSLQSLFDGFDTSVHGTLLCVAPGTSHNERGLA